eukprot:578016-Pyramimonas_sp.AAC.2
MKSPPLEEAMAASMAVDRTVARQQGIGAERARVSTCRPVAHRKAHGSVPVDGLRAPVGFNCNVQSCCHHITLLLKVAYRVARLSRS